MPKFFLFSPFFLKLEDMKDTMVELEKFDKMQVIKKNREKQIKKNLEQCKDELKASSPPPTVSPGTQAKDINSLFSSFLATSVKEKYCFTD